jgi:DNA-binding NtrC family response regulator
MTPLRDRREDLGLLVATLLRKAGVGDGDRAHIAPDLGLELLQHDWPLNVDDQALQQRPAAAQAAARGNVTEAAKAKREFAATLSNRLPSSADGFAPHTVSFSGAPSRSRRSAA